VAIPPVTIFISGTIMTPMQDGLSQQAVADHLLALPKQFSERPEFIECVAALREGKPATFDSVWGSGCALDFLIDDLSSFFDGQVDRFPSHLPGDAAATAIDPEYGERLRLLKSVGNRDAGAIIVATVPALLQPAPAKKTIFGHAKKIRVGDQLNVDEFVAWLLEHQFHRTTAVELPGEFSMRGGIIDVFATDWEAPVRIELFDDEIESLRQFETSTQLSNANLQEIEVAVVAQDAVADSSLFDYLPKGTVVLLHEPESLLEHCNRYLERSPEGERLYSWDSLNQQWAGFALASASQVTTGFVGARWQLPIDSVEKFSGDIGDLKLQVDRLYRDTGKEQELYVLAKVEGELPRVREILSSTAAASQGHLHFGVGCVHAGFRIRDQRQVIVGCDQMFHRTELRRTGKKRLSKAIDSFLDLREGDLVVHLSHGIGRFRGLEMLDKDGQMTEHLVLEFYGGTKLYVPATKIDLVQKYIGGSKTRPVLAKIGGKSWVKQKASVESAIADMAAEMIELQAQRSGQAGIAFGIEAIKHDMQTPESMDRLLCGDVGFGKTEVAMRAAFKAVENGYQVGVLVPTTILAEQHYKNFRERMGGFPIRIGKLSRFATTKEIKETKAGLASGAVDIAIGTHRLVSKDIKFCNLGLVVIDEEQRFGVEHKERLKTLRSAVDVLTMSATPIPRTLHMSLVGVRDISNLETAPAERSGVQTKVLRYNNEVIRDGILREVGRGGQVFFVHNRVKDIHLVKQRLESLVPEVSFRFGHGQMNERDLENVMADFIAGFSLMTLTAMGFRICTNSEGELGAINVAPTVIC